VNTNIIEIAKKAGVSIATVSRALNNNGAVREETRQKILSICKEFNYKPNPHARGLSRKKTDTIGVILPELIDEFFMDIIHGIDEEAYKANKFVLISSSHTQRNIIETLLEFMGSGRVDGVILMVPQLPQQTAELIKQSRRPVILLNVTKDLKDVVSFNIDNYQGAFTITEHLIKHDYQTIAMIQGPAENCDAQERFRGYREALLQCGLPFEKNLTVSGDFTVKSGYDGFNRLIKQSGKPEAIFAANDMMAVGIYEAVRQVGMKIPEDVAVVGFDDIYLSCLLQPRLTTVHVPIQELGSRAVRYLFKLTNGDIDPVLPYREILTTGLVIGGSCGCPYKSGHNLF
jgi:DNA-binding LacI/PurR family transcriptional regulator